MYYKKQFGQNFLIDKNIIYKIANSILPEFNEVYEIGPGHGALTKQLLFNGKNVKAIEIDLDCVNFLQEKFQNYIVDKKLEIINYDALKYAFPYACIVGNLPYNVGTKIIENFVYNNIPFGVFMLQKEVAERISGKDFCALSIFIQSCYDVVKLIDVDATAFKPRPKIKSQVIVLKEHKKYPELDIKKLSQILRIVFAMPRKQISFLRKNNDNLLSALLKHGVCLDNRAADISKEIFYKIAEKGSIF